jgi:hypothetical protein
VDGVVTSDEEVRKLMLDKEAWRSRIKIIVDANKEVDSSMKEKLGAIKPEELLLLFSIILLSSEIFYRDSLLLFVVSASMLVVAGGS